MAPVQSRLYSIRDLKLKLDHTWWEDLAITIIDARRKRKRKAGTLRAKRAIKSHFGLDSDDMAITWHLMIHNKCLSHLKTNERNPKHFLYALYFLRNYCNEEKGASFFGISENTWGKYFWMYVDCIRMLTPKLVSTSAALVRPPGWRVPHHADTDYQLCTCRYFLRTVLLGPLEKPLGRLGAR